MEEAAKKTRWSAHPTALILASTVYPLLIDRASQQSPDREAQNEARTAVPRTCDAAKNTIEYVFRFPIR